MLTSGSIYILDKDVTHLPAEKRANYLARVFQDPKMGTAPRMTVAENLLIAKYRGEKRGLLPRKFMRLPMNFKRWLHELVMVLKSIWKRRLGFYQVGNVKHLACSWQR